MAEDLGPLFTATIKICCEHSTYPSFECLAEFRELTSLWLPFRLDDLEVDIPIPESVDNPLVMPGNRFYIFVRPQHKNYLLGLVTHEHQHWWKYIIPKMMLFLISSNYFADNLVVLYYVVSNVSSTHIHAQIV